MSEYQSKSNQNAHEKWVCLINIKWMYNDQENDCFELVLNMFFTQFSLITKKMEGNSGILHGMIN